MKKKQLSPIQQKTHDRIQRKVKKVALPKQPEQPFKYPDFQTKMNINVPLQDLSK